jgi:hypothetical protein
MHALKVDPTLTPRNIGKFLNLPIYFIYKFIKKLYKQALQLLRHTGQFYVVLVITKGIFFNSYQNDTYYYTIRMTLK